MKYLTLPALLFMASECYAQEWKPTTESVCQPERLNEMSIPSQLMSYLGEWTSCSLEAYETNEFGTYALTVMTWDNVELTIKNSAPETTIYTVTTTSQSPLNAEWYSLNRENLVNEFFEMNWDFNNFPGPSSEHFVSPDRGSNAQFWAERDRGGNVTWMRFSYAL